MKKITLFITLIAFTFGSAQNLVKSSPLNNWTGYASWSNADGSEPGGGAWGLADVKTTLDGDYSITLQPNFSTYAAAVDNGAQSELDYWTDGQGGGGKIFEGTTKIDLDPSFNGQDLTFSGYVVSNTLDSEYSVTYFIKALNPDTGFSDAIEGTSGTIDSTGAFSISAAGTDLASGLILQVGFTVTGLNANPADESALGSVVIVADASTTNSPSSNEVVVDPLYSWTGYASWSNADGSEPGGGAWGLADVKTTLDGDYSITLQPNFSTYAAAVDNGSQGELDYWTDGQGGGGKIFEGTTKIDLDPSFNGQDLTFSGYVVSNTLDSEYSVTYFIKALNPATGYSDAIEGTSGTIDSTGAFSINAAGTDLASGLILQVGFTVTGLNANPDDESALGSVVIVADASTASVNDNVFNAVKMFPNPAKDTVQFSVNSNENLDIEIFDMLGKSVLRVNAVQNEVNIADLNSGLYFVQMTLGTQQATKKLVVN